MTIAEPNLSVANANPRTEKTYGNIEAIEKIRLAFEGKRSNETAKTDPDK